MKRFFTIVRPTLVVLVVLRWFLVAPAQESQTKSSGGDKESSQSGFTGAGAGDGDTMAAKPGRADGLGNLLLREAAGQAAKVRIREQCLWARIADNIERVYFTVTGGGRPTTSAKKPNTRVEAATEAADRAKRIAG
jgi:hypothetical protein